MRNFLEKGTNILFCFSIVRTRLIEEHLLGSVPIDEDIDAAAHLLFFFTLEEAPKGRLCDVLIRISMYEQGYILSMAVLLLRVVEVRFYRKS